MTLNKKFGFRWLGITLVCIGYYSLLFLYNFIFSLDFSSTMSQGGGEISSSVCYAVIDDLFIEHTNAMTVSYLGFIVCVALILLINKKVR